MSAISSYTSNISLTFSPLFLVNLRLRKSTSSQCEMPLLELLLLIPLNSPH